MSAPHLLSFLHPAASCSPPPIAVLTWMLAMEERLGRQAVHIAELEARHDITALLARSYFAMSTSCPRSEWRPVRSEPGSQLECLAAASSGHRENDGDAVTKQLCRAASCAEPLSPTAFSLRHTQASAQTGALARQDENGTRRSTPELPLSSFWQQLADLDDRLTEVEWTTVHCEGSQPTAAARRPQQHRVDSSRPTMDDCVALLDSLLTSQEGTRTPQWNAMTADAELPRRQQRPSQETERHLPLQLHSRQQYILSVLAKLRDALRSTQASYKAATGIRTPVSLETLLQLPPETLPLLMCTDDGTRDVRQPQCSHPCDASGGTAACCGLLSSTSIYTLWATLMDGVDTLPCFSRAVAEALWAAVLWMHVCATLAPPRHGETPASAPAGRRSNAAGEDAAPHGQTFFAPIASGKGEIRSHVRPLRAEVQQQRAASASPLQRRPVRSEAEPRQLRSPSEARQRLAVRQQRAIAPTLKSRLQEEEERWAYRDFPVRRGFTAPTVYDDLFPLPTAVSAFVKPPVYTVPSPSLLAERSSGAAVAEAKEEAATTVELGFYTGPARRPRSLV
ncbi:hypothetical protein LMJF_18_0750 [Leishmania major strain Friedlin]|uniref:Uncharacterized protein n=1 Tax=Leishmania major TaxID=5664 RepID=Q4QDW7_LEIMA|nr:hypothetical protein LMJF_18_0750 [Leishmania major strain Friedlin]CAG9572460.1 hypothetical_protein_-_conserved [Leishmania major strain Friedlin]CAJ03732.1 hypothetical protein LMJF_18_0750 [Leishmania major strain Friedlin]|eukprot:XP_001682481.1 hypothetical protein LMJF_18_0750 [Leishmania major strain Friedlin]